jgi:adenylate cyclase
MVYRLGDAELSPDRYELRRSGVALRLEPRVFEVLSYLVEHRDRVVTKQELLDRLWRGQVVGEAALTRAVRAARHALAAPGGAEWIRTIYGRGFMYTGPVDETAAPPGAQAHPPATAPPPARPSVAVLPFADLSPARDQAHFCEGLAEELRDTLVRIEGLAVASRSSTLAMGRPGADIRTIAERANVTAVLEGTVRRHGGRFRVTARLVDAADNYALWSASFDSTSLDLLAVQADIAERAAAAMRVALSEADRRALRRSARVELDAYDYYLRGRLRCGRPSGRNLEAGRQMYRRAIEVAPGYAPAHAGFADCCAFLYLCWGGPDDDLAAADRSSREALRLAPDLAEAHAARGTTLAILGDDAGAARAFESALRLKPRLPKLAYLAGRYHFGAGRVDAAARHLEQAEVLGGHGCAVPGLLAKLYERLGDGRAARAAHARAADSAEAEIAHCHDDARPFYVGAVALAALGHARRALEWADRALALAPGDQVALVFAAAAAARAGRMAEARRHLHAALAGRFRQTSWLQHDPDLARVTAPAAAVAPARARARSAAR